MPFSRAIRTLGAVVLAAGVLAGCAGASTSGSAGKVTAETSAGGAVTSAAVASGAVTSAAVTSAAVTSGAVTSGAVPTDVQSTAAAAIEPSAPAPVAEPPVVAPELQFTSTTLDGEEFSGASLAGKPAMLWFWAPWCPNCRAEAPQVAAAAAASGDVTFVGVAAQDELPAMQSFVDNYGVGGFEHLADLDASIWQRFGVTYQPAYAFIGADGSVEVVKSRVSEEELASRLEQLTAP